MGKGVTEEKKTVDISALGLKSGLEIHQQLDTRKLFCRCPCVIREDAPDFEITRYLRASAGETGEVDAAAAAEQVKAKRFRYQGYDHTTCLVELDEEPPHPLNDDALNTTLQVAKLVGSTILDEVHVMRKTVVDGSNTSGFQRTSLIALGGKLLDNAVRIQAICLEEDSCKIVERTSKEDIYNLSRLGIPLIEIATEPDISTPEQAMAVAAEIGMILRSTGKCKRGLGTIRQDLNVSIKEGARVEIKGAQDLKMIPEWVRNEALRQHGLIQIMKELKKKGLKEVILPAPHDVSKFFEKSAPSFVTKGIDKGDSLVGIAVPAFEGLLGTELFDGFRLGTEVAGYAKAFGFGGIIHSDEDPKKYKFTPTEIASVKKKLGAKKGDAFILLLGEKEKIEEFFAFVFIPRMEQLLHGIPGEVRKANPDGSTRFLRPMPGAARMYPETDIPRVVVDQSKIKVPKLLREQEADLVKEFNIPPAHAKELLREGLSLDEYVKAFKNLRPAFLATTLLDTPKELKKRHNKAIDLDEHEVELKVILGKVNDGSIPKDAVIELLALVADGKKPDFAKYKAVDDGEIEKVIKEVIKADPKAPINALMGQAMAKLRGKASGQKVMELLRKHT